MSKLSVAALNKRYKSRTVVHDVSLDVASGEVVGLLGPNGAGKTTCFYMIVGLVAADGGRIELDGDDLTRMPIHSARAPRPVVPAAGGVDLPQADGRRERAGDPRAAGPRRRRDRQPPRRAARGPVDLASCATRPRSASPAASGAASRSPARWRPGPRFILLDEPFAGVDPIAVLDIQKIIGFLKEREIGVLITDHNVRETLGICDRAYIINEGRVLASGTPDEIVYNENVRKVYLGEHFRL